MKRNDIPVSVKQLVYFAFLILLPLALSMTAVFWAPPKPGSGMSDDLWAVGIVAAIAIILIGVLIIAARRHEIEISRDALVVRHSLYTLALDRKEVESVQIREVTSLDQLGLSTRKNGIAAFGYFSGWFWDAHGNLTFCALSSYPVYLITFKGSSKCRQLALCATPEVVRSIEKWAGA